MRNTPTAILFALVVAHSSASRCCAQTSAGFIHVKCEPGCSVSVDGELKGQTLAEEDGLIVRSVPTGERTIRIEKAGFRPQTYKLVVNENAVAVLEVAFLNVQPTVTQQGDPIKRTVVEVGDLVIRTLPTECRISIPRLGIDSRKNKDVWRLSRVDAGQYTVIVEALNRETAFPLTIPKDNQVHVFVDVPQGHVCDVNAATLALLSRGLWVDKNLGASPDDWMYRVRVSGSALRPQVDLELNYVKHQRRGSDGLAEDRVWDSYQTRAEQARFSGEGYPASLAIRFEARHMNRRYDVSRILTLSPDKNELQLTKDGDVHWTLVRGGGQWRRPELDDFCGPTGNTMSERSETPGHLVFRPEDDAKEKYRFYKGYLRISFQGADLVANREYPLAPGRYAARAYSSKGKADQVQTITWQTRTKSTEAYHFSEFFFDIKPGHTTVLTGDITGEWNGDGKHHDGQWRPELFVQLVRE